MWLINDAWKKDMSLVLELPLTAVNQQGLFHNWATALIAAVHAASSLERGSGLELWLIKDGLEEG